MKFLVDAHLPRRLALAITATGHDAIHTLDLADANKTTDSQINAISETEERVVITKDSDFVDSLLLEGKPYKLLLISTGNIKNSELEALFLPQLPTIVEAFENARFIELNQSALVIHS
jgi:predicted nuclease of predicted toxin-antitoxin system